MDVLMLPGPDGRDSHGAEQPGAEPSGHRKRAPHGPGQQHPKPEITSREECLRALRQLPGLVAVGAITPNVGNSIRAVYDTILKHHEREEGAQGETLRDADVVSIFRISPEVANMLDPLLTDHQREILFKDATEGGDDG